MARDHGPCVAKAYVKTRQDPCWCSITPRPQHRVRMTYALHIAGVTCMRCKGSEFHIVIKFIVLKSWVWYQVQISPIMPNHES